MHTKLFEFVDPTTMTVVRTETVEAFGSPPGPLRDAERFANCAPNGTQKIRVADGTILSAVNNPNRKGAFLAQYLESEVGSGCAANLLSRRLTPISDQAFRPIFTGPNGAEVWFVSGETRTLYQANNADPDNPIGPRPAGRNTRQ